MNSIVIFTQNLDIGGVQKSVSTLANHLIKFYKVEIVLAEDNKKTLYSLDSIKIHKIKTLEIDISKPNIGEKIFAYRIKELDSLLHKIKPDLIMSYEDYNNLILLHTSFKARKVISCRVSIEDSYKNKKIHLLNNNFYLNNIKNHYSKADKIITVSNYIENELKMNFNLMNTITIHNGIEDIEDIEDIDYNNFILNIGRLHKQKGQENLIKAFYKIKDKISQNLLIVGEGTERENLKCLVESLNLSNRVFLIGFDTPYKYIKKCDLFVFPSYYEGFSNTILEVMHMKKSIISYNYSGANEILPRESLVEVSDISGLSRKILYFTQNKDISSRLALQLYNKSLSFKLENTLNNYHNQIKQLLI